MPVRHENNLYLLEASASEVQHVIGICHLTEGNGQGY